MKMKIIYKKSKQTNLEGERLTIRKYKSEDEKTNFTANDLTPEGLVVRVHTIIEREGKYADDYGNIKPYWVIEGKTWDAEGDEEGFEMTTGNARLRNMIARELAGRSLKEKGNGVFLKLFGDGTGFSRHYWVVAGDSREELESYKEE